MYGIYGHISIFPDNMSNIRQRFHDSLGRIVQDNFIGNTIKRRWELYPSQDHKFIIKKLRLVLVLSWVLGNKVHNMTPVELMTYTIDEYRKYDYDNYVICG